MKGGQADQHWRDQQRVEALAARKGGLLAKPVQIA